MTIASLILVSFTSTRAVAQPPQSFDEVAEIFQKVSTGVISEVVTRAFKGNCYLATTKTKARKGYFGAPALGGLNNDVGYEIKIGTVYAEDKHDLTKGDVFNSLLSRWGHLRSVSINDPIVIDNEEGGLVELRKMKDASAAIVGQSKLKQDFPCNNIDPELKPLCTNGIIPAGTVYAACYYDEELW